MEADEVLGADVLLPNFRVPNWSSAYSLQLGCKHAFGVAPSTVQLYFHAGGALDFRHYMTSLQARQMARDLVACADALDKLESRKLVLRSPSLAYSEV